MVYEYFKDGKLKKIVEYEKGTKNGIEINFHSNGTIMNMKKWKNGKVLEDVKEYNEYGEQVNF